jgi:hypothetical protein
MNDTTSMGLRLQVRVRGVSSGGGEEVTLYAISGLPPDDSCIVGCAGEGLDGKKHWYLRWERSGNQLATPEAAYASPQDALKAVAKLYEWGI